MKRQWLITAFEAFGGRPDNNSENVMNEILKIALDLEKTSEWPFQFHYKVLPVEYDRCYDFLKTEMSRLEKSGVRFEGVLALGEGGEDFKLESQANNLDDVPDFPDNAGTVRHQKKIFADLDADETIPLKFPFEAFARIRKSVNAGFFVCNHLCAKLGREFQKKANAPYIGFIHVPRTGQGGVFTSDVCAAIIVNGFRKIP